MIVPMKKIFMVTQKKDMVSALEKLRDLGLVHVEHLASLGGERLGELKDQAALLSRVIAVLSSKEYHSKKVKQLSLTEWELEAEKIIDWLAQIGQLKEGLIKQQVIISHWEPWGDFNPRDLVELNQKGVRVCLCELPTEDMHELPHEFMMRSVYRVGKNSRCLAVCSDPDTPWPFEQIPLPPEGIVRMRGQQDQARYDIGETKGKIADAVQYLDAFKSTLKAIQDALRFEEVSAGTRKAETLAVLKGFVPVASVDQLEKKAAAEQWGLVVEDPDDGDQVPTLLKNPKWVEMIKPVFGMIEIMPGYAEVDISAFFLVFFSVFFGILIGDAGYGLLFMLGTLIVHLKLKNKVKDHNPFILMYVLSLCAVAWGVLTGTFFGQQWLEHKLNPMVPWLTKQENVQLLCFFIGGIHLSIAHIWRMILKFPSASFIGEIGWISMLWFMFFLSKTLVLGHPFPSASNVLGIGGAVLIVFFTKPNINPLKAIGPGMGEIALNGINSFTDIVSYIRLFAVGLASVAVADAFNSMALEIGFGSFFIGLGSALILVVGHGFNIVLGAMSILVHGLRLNVLEFSGHLNIEWAGQKFNPFQRLKNVSE